jgi:trehalose-6-phosphate synthase
MGKSAILVNPYNVNEIHKKLNMLFKSSYLRKKIIKRGYKNVLRYDYFNSKIKYLNLYKKIIDYNLVNN